MNDKEAKKKEIKKQENKDTIVTIAIAALALVTVVGLIFFLRANPENKQAEEFTQQEKVDITLEDNENAKGSENASVTVVEYGDFQCPACQFQAPFVSQIAEDYPEDVRVVYRHFPLVTIHKNAMRAARASEAAARQGKFFEMHDVLFEKQDEWAESDNALDTFKQYAKDLELNEEQFASDLEDGSLDNKINQDVKSATVLGLDSTPTLFVNGVKIASPASYQEFKGIIEAAIEEAKGGSEDSNQDSSTQEKSESSEDSKTEEGSENESEQKASEDQ